MSAAVTPWFCIAIHGQPVRVGTYEVLYVKSDPDDIQRRYWDGKQWLFGADHKRMIGFGNIKSDHHNEAWRGLAADPEASE